MWITHENIQIFVDILVPAVLVYMTYKFNIRLKEIDENNDKRRLKEIEEKEQQKDKQERRDKLRIELSVAAKVVGVQKGYYLVEFATTINNKSLIKQHQFTNINLRVRGLKDEDAIELWSAKVDDEKSGETRKVCTSRLKFPEKLIDENILPPSLPNIFVEPGVKQILTFPTRIPDDIHYILATVHFRYDNIPKPHTAERLINLREGIQTGEDHE